MNGFFNFNRKKEEEDGQADISPERDKEKMKNMTVSTFDKEVFEREETRKEVREYLTKNDNTTGFNINITELDLSQLEKENE